MCTASWLHQDCGYQLLFNRDETRGRLAALQPRVERRGGLQVITPVDGDHGGAWIAVNDRGVTLCLLNGAHHRTGIRSRGLLLSELAGARTAAEAVEELQARDLSLYAALTLVVLEPHQTACIAEWNGALQVRQESAEAPLPLCSSSFDTDGVRLRRREEFQRITHGWPVSAARLFQFHSSHGHAASAYSPCMHRADAHTVSFSWITVSPQAVHFSYSPAAPCRRADGCATSLPRQA